MILSVRVKTSTTRGPPHGPFLCWILLDIPGLPHFQRANGSTKLLLFGFSTIQAGGQWPSLPTWCLKVLTPDCQSWIHEFLQFADAFPAQVDPPLMINACGRPSHHLAGLNGKGTIRHLPHLKISGGWWLKLKRDHKPNLPPAKLKHWGHIWFSRNRDTQHQKVAAIKNSIGDITSFCSSGKHLVLRPVAFPAWYIKQRCLNHEN